MNRRCDWLLKTIKDNKTIENVSKERIINTDHYCLRKPITKRVHIKSLLALCVLHMALCMYEVPVSISH